MRRNAVVVLMLLAVVACGDNPTLSTTPTTRATTSTVPGVTDTATTDTATSTETVSTTDTIATTTTTRPLGPRATFKAAGRTLQVRASAMRRPYAELGDQLPVPADVQVDLGAPSAESVVGVVVARDAWDSGDTGEVIETFAGGEPGRFIWAAAVPPGEYALEVTFTITGIPVGYRAPIRVT